MFALTNIDEPQTQNMENMALNSKQIKTMFNETMTNLLFVSTSYQSIRDIDLVRTSI